MVEPRIGLILVFNSNSFDTIDTVDHLNNYTYGDHHGNT